MKIKNIFAGALLLATFGGIALTGCSESELYSADAPDWIADSVSSAAARRSANGGEAAFEAETVVSEGWWSNWSANYPFPENQRMTISVTLNKSARGNLWENWAMVCSTTDWTTRNDASTGYGEYFVVRGDGGNWNGSGKVTVTTTDEMPIADASYANFMQDGTEYTIVADHYPTGGVLINCSQKNPAGEEYHWTATGTAEAGKGIWVFFAGEQSSFTITNITYENLTELKPVKLEVAGTPSSIEIYSGEDEAPISLFYGSGVATITWDNGTTSEVSADDLTFSVIPDLSTLGTATVAVAYGKTSMGQFCQPVTTTYNLEVTNPITQISAKCKVDGKTFYYYDTDITLVNTSQFEVTATYADESTGPLDPANVTFSVSTDGKVMATYNDITSEVSNATALKGTQAAGDQTYPSWIATAFGSVASGETKTVKVFVYAAGTQDWQCALPEISGTSANGGWTLCFNGNNWGFADATMTAELLQNDFYIEGSFDHPTRAVEAAKGLDYTIAFTNNGDGTAIISEKATTSDGIERTISLKLSNVPETFDIDVTIDGAYAIFHE